MVILVILRHLKRRCEFLNLLSLDCLLFNFSVFIARLNCAFYRLILLIQLSTNSSLRATGEVSEVSEVSEVGKRSKARDK